LPAIRCFVERSVSFISLLFIFLASNYIKKKGPNRFTNLAVDQLRFFGLTLGLVASTVVEGYICTAKFIGELGGRRPDNCLVIPTTSFILLHMA
jgi:hypothetical protein